MSAHHPYGPSGLSSIVGCPGKVTAIAEAIADGKIPAEDQSGPAAIEGNLLHDVAYKEGENDYAVRLGYPPPHRVTGYHELSDYQQDLARFALQAADDLWTAEGGCAVSGSHAVQGFEEQVDLGIKAKETPEGVGNIFGTVDRLVHSKANRHLIVADYKFGRGEVQATENDQLQAYALMAVYSWLVKLRVEDPSIQSPEKITLVIIQPRVGEKIKKWETDLNGLHTWWQTRILPALRKSTGSNPGRVPSESNCRWCRVSGGLCQAENERLDWVVNKHPVGELAEDLPEYRKDLNKLVHHLGHVKQWIEGIEERGLKAVQDAIGLPDFKAVAGKRGNKVWVEEDKADKFLSRQGLKKADRSVTKLITPAVALTTLKKRPEGVSAKAITTMEKYYEQKPGKPVIALKTDRRPALPSPGDVKAEDALFQENPPNVSAPPVDNTPAPGELPEDPTPPKTTTLLM